MYLTWSRRLEADRLPWLQHKCMFIEYISMNRHRNLRAWRHQMKTFSVLLGICAGNSPVPGEFPAQRPVTRSFDVFFDLRLNKRLSKQSWGWWFETVSCPLWRHRNGWTTCYFWFGSDTNTNYMDIYNMPLNVELMTYCGLPFRMYAGCWFWSIY